MLRTIGQAFAIALFVLVAIKMAASLATVSIGPIATLLGLVVLVIWFLNRHDLHL